jgi:hypothetical protein
MANNAQKKDKSYLLGLLLLLLSGFFMILFLIPEKKPQTGEGNLINAKAFEAKVNKHLFDTSQKMEMSREKMELEMKDLARKGVRPIQEQPEAPKDIDLSTDPRAETLLRELGRDVKAAGDPTSPNDLIQAELFEEQQLQDYSEEYKREYAHKFVENAKKAGYLVQLNDQYKVISVTPIRKPAQNFQLFDPNGHSAQ